MAAEGSIPSIPLSTMIHMVNIKLTSANYLLWHAQIESLLITQGFLPHLDGSSPCPSREITTPAGTKSTNPEFAAWYSRDQLIRLFLVSTLTEESMAVVIGCTSSRDVWTSLTRAYSHASKARELSLKDDLLSVKRGDLSVSEYGQRFKAICDKLAAIGRSIDSTDKSHWFLRGLGPAFSTFTAAQLAQEPLPDFDTLLARAESHQFFQRSSDISSSSSSVAFYAAPRARPPASSQPQGRCKKNKAKGRRQPWCYFCREENHDAWDCPRRFDRSFTRPSQSSTTANLAEALSSSCTISQPNVSDWYLDTGASAHITSDASQLDDLTDYNGSDRVTVGNGDQLPITQSGSLFFSNSFYLRDVLVVPGMTKNLLSVSKLTSDLPVHVIFTDSSLRIQHKDSGNIIATGVRDSGLYRLDLAVKALAAHTSISRRASSAIWHSRLGHSSPAVLSTLVNLKLLSVTSGFPNRKILHDSALNGRTARADHVRRIVVAVVALLGDELDLGSLNLSPKTLRFDRRLVEEQILVSAVIRGYESKGFLDSNPLSNNCT
ncbi:Unknown protein [Striga hermonthica]|uniref:Uncharacterized protein n=1 Tax=Striga hermonthica TaxID=68872 RepID=A0A9N7MKV7_STRHE|nr:Unknown protein [Striga hermonthica]